MVLDTCADLFVDFERDYSHYFGHSCFFLFLEWDETVSPGTMVASDHFVLAHLYK